MLVQGLVTAVVPSGLNIRFLGFCDGSVDLFHVGEKAPKKGDKVSQGSFRILLLRLTRIARSSGDWSNYMGHDNV